MKLKPIPGGCPKRSAIRFPRAAWLSFFVMSATLASVSAAPKPTNSGGTARDRGGSLSELPGDHRLRCGADGCERRAHDEEAEPSRARESDRGSLRTASRYRLELHARPDRGD